MIKGRILLLSFSISMLISCSETNQTRSLNETKLIDRKALVSRHNVKLEKPDIWSPLSVGNGKFCFTADVTGMQTFPADYRDGIPG